MRWNWMTPLFNADGDIGAASEGADIVTEQSSVETGAESPADGSAPAAASSGSSVDVTQQESFATRLKQEREKLEQQYQPAKQHASRVEQIAKAAGFPSVEEYLDAVDAQLKEREAAEAAERMQVDQETYNKFFAPVHEKLTNAEKELQRLQQADLERQIRADYERLSTQYPDFKDHEDTIWALATERRLPLEDAYKLVSYDSRIAAAKQEAEQQVLANVTGRDQKQVLSGKDQGANTTLDPSNMSLSEIAAISARVQRGERITL
ncbi:hypothetical protein [Paenibacillus sp. IITD108]|uniref:hypothetical protein n=1 Tax=Paenibacillus sp. IITD108 TaxID=3116649 RepID=UPI002F41AB64